MTVSHPTNNTDNNLGQRRKRRADDVSRLLRINPDPIKIVDRAVRDVWTRATVTGWRCEHEDGRGRCTSRDTIGVWDTDLRSVAFLCAKHVPKGDE